MHTDHLTAHQLAKALRECPDIDLAIDINSAFLHLSKQNQEFINLFSQGYSVSGAAKKIGMRVNPQRLFNQIIKRMLKEVNADAADSINRRNVQREDDTSEGADQTWILTP